MVRATGALSDSKTFSFLDPTIALGDDRLQTYVLAPKTCCSSKFCVKLRKSYPALHVAGCELGNWAIVLAGSGLPSQVRGTSHWPAPCRASFCQLASQSKAASQPREKQL